MDYHTKQQDSKTADKQVSRSRLIVREGATLTFLTLKRGFTLLEIVIGAAIITSSLLGIAHVFGNLAQLSSRYPAAVKASFLLEETSEVARVMRDIGWSQIGGWTPGSTYHLIWTGNTWATSTSPVLVDGFDRTLTVAEAYRDQNYDLVTSGGTLDPNTRLVTAEVSWLAGGAGTITRTVSFYLTNIFNE